MLGFWRRGTLEGRLNQLEASPINNLILAVSKSLQGGVEGFGEAPAGIVYFREIIPPREVVALAEAVGARPDSASDP